MKSFLALLPGSVGIGQNGLTTTQKRHAPDIKVKLQKALAGEENRVSLCRDYTPGRVLGRWILKYLLCYAIFQKDR
jgi:hypothetical protein